eukprot:6180493-Pleurochrysis_carterae.AAC.3
MTRSALLDDLVSRHELRSSRVDGAGGLSSHSPRPLCASRHSSPWTILGATLLARRCRYGRCGLRRRRPSPLCAYFPMQIECPSAIWIELVMHVLLEALNAEAVGAWREQSLCV